MKKTFIISLLIYLTGNSFAQQIQQPGIKQTATTFAIVIDSITYEKTRAEVMAYKQAVEAQGLGVYVVSHQWTAPEQIRTVLQQLYKQRPRLEGAVLIGDIPIPMIRDAQFMTTAFKMDQRHPWQRSSVPSDRFYDDFDLQFDFLKQDSLRKDYFYYSLSPSSPQYISMDIYTARIKPPVMINGKDKYALIKSYLQKVVAEKQRQNKLDHAFVFTGHGYHSQALDAWAGEQLALRDQLPELFLPGNAIRFLNYRMAPEMKFSLLSALQQKDMDLAIFHEHGTEDEQVINGYAEASNPQPSIENVKRYLRNKIQNVESKKGDIQQAKESYAKSLGVPLAWMDNALEDAVKKADSLANANQDIHLTDLAAIHPEARFVMLDACENGSFHLDDYLAGYYPFGDGGTVLCMANSIGVLQDNWSNEMLGLLSHGVRAGNWLRQVAFPETHLFGDPTFAFAAKDIGLNNDIVNQMGNVAVWQKRLQQGDVDTRALALSELYRIQQKGAAGLLKQQYFSAQSGAVRLEAMLLLYKCNTPEYYDVLKAAVNDPYELVRRLAARMIGDAGRDDLVPALVQLTITDRNNARVMAAVRNSLSFMNTSAVLAAASSLTDSVYREKLANDARRTQERLLKDSKTTFDTTAVLKERYFNITTLRNYNYHSLVPQVIQLAKDKTDNEKLRVAAIEALSWFTHSYQRGLILEMCEVLLGDKTERAAVKEQAARTKSIVENF